MISQKINNTDDLKKVSDKIDFKKITDKISLKEIADKTDLKNDETSQPSYKNDYEYYIKNPNILADKIVEIYDNNPNAKVYNPKNKQNKVKLQNVVNKIDRDDYLTKVFVQSSVGNLNLYRQDSIYKRKNILNTQFEFIEVTFLNKNYKIIELKDFFSISLFIM